MIALGKFIIQNNVIVTINTAIISVHLKYFVNTVYETWTNSSIMC